MKTPSAARICDGNWIADLTSKTRVRWISQGGWISRIVRPRESLRGLPAPEHRRWRARGEEGHRELQNLETVRDSLQCLADLELREVGQTTPSRSSPTPPTSTPKRTPTRSSPRSEPAVDSECCFSRAITVDNSFGNTKNAGTGRGEEDRKNAYGAHGLANPGNPQRPQLLLAIYGHERGLMSGLCSSAAG